MQAVDIEIFEDCKIQSIYIAGPMAGYEDHNYPAFDEAAKVLRYTYPDILFVPVHEIDHGESIEARGTKHHYNYMKVDLPHLLSCDAIALLPGWPASKGAMIELNTAVACGLYVYIYQEGYLWIP